MSGLKLINDLVIHKGDSNLVSEITFDGADYYLSSFQIRKRFLLPNKKVLISINKIPKIGDTTKNYIEEYSDQVFAWFNENPMDNHLLDYLHSCVGLSGEVGELLDEVKKNVFHSKPPDLAKIKSEAGDILFYYLVFLKLNQLSLREVINYNILKITERYPNGREKNYMISKPKENFSELHNKTKTK